MKKQLLYLLIFTILFIDCISITKSRVFANTLNKSYLNEEKFYRFSYFNYMKSELYKGRGELDLALASLLKAIKNDPKSLFLEKELIALYLYKNDREKALKAAEIMVEKNPDDTDCLLILAKLKEIMDKKNESLKIYERILSLNPDKKNIYLILGNIYMNKKDIDKSFNIYLKMLKHFPNSYIAHFFLGKIHVIKKNFTRAEKEFLKTLELKSNLIEPRLELIKIYKSHKTQKKIDLKIIQLYQKILEIDEYNIMALIELPLYYYKHGKIDKADKIFRQINIEKSNYNDFIIFISKEFIIGERYKDASIILTSLLKSFPNNSIFHYFAGIVFYELKQSKKAIKHFLNIAPDSPYYIKIINYIALLYKKNENNKKAIKFLEEKHKKFPENIEIITFLGAFYEDEKEYNKALNILNKGVLISPDNDSIIFNIGVVQDKLGQKNKCIESMKQVIKLKPNNATALNYLGYTYADAGINLDIAEQLILKAMGIKPNDGFITDSMGWVYFKKGLFSKAVRFLEKAASLIAFDPVILEHLGDAYKHEKKYKLAIDIYKKILLKSKTKKIKIEKKIRELEKELKLNVSDYN
ncbi:MAG: hypothetical protein B6I26_05290 [Desulfobacteraceae bacterium 4572_130]|nr:MAG: hypothetical protein B6I26_05290 [Desulfobacteraceae bacterium 4572_130]